MIELNVPNFITIVIIALIAFAIHGAIIRATDPAKNSG